MDKSALLPWLWVFLGGGAGSVVRFGLGRWCASVASFPVATLAANVVAALVIGVLWTSGKSSLPVSTTWLLLAVGFCGGLSTFSTFSLETFQLMQQGHYAMAILNVVLSVLLSLSAVWFISRL